MIGHHPDICRCEEMDFVTPLLARYPGEIPLPECWHELSTDRGFGLSGYEIDSSLDFIQLARSFLEQRQRIDGRPSVGATVHHHFSLLPKIWPDGRFIYVNRDPRDVARSCMAMGWGGTAWKASTIWRDAHHEWERLKAALPAEQLFEVRFEQLVSDPESVLRGVAAFLDVPYSAAMQEIEEDTTYRRPNPMEAQSWRGQASEREIREVEARIGPDLFEKAGYPLSGLPALPVDGRTLTQIELTDVLRRVKFRIGRYGFWLWCLGVVSRRLPLRSLGDPIKLKINQVDNRHLK